MAELQNFPAIASIWRNNKKGTLYKVLYAGTHTETGEALVVYQGVGDNAPADPDDCFGFTFYIFRSPKFKLFPSFSFEYGTLSFKWLYFRWCVRKYIDGVWCRPALMWREKFTEVSDEHFIDDRGRLPQQD